jgi:hypothetical protein
VISNWSASVVIQNWSASAVIYTVGGAGGGCHDEGGFEPKWMLC